jgi:hypothetical protein
MIGKIFKKKEKKENNQILNAEIIGEGIREKAGKAFNFLREKTYLAKDEFYIILGKLKNLREANYNLGIMHLEKGNINDAIFRFKLMTKFWPDDQRSYYYLAYCLTVKNELLKAKIVLEKFKSHNFQFDQKTTDLQEKIDSLINKESKNV